MKLLGFLYPLKFWFRIIVGDNPHEYYWKTRYLWNDSIQSLIVLFSCPKNTPNSVHEANRIPLGTLLYTKCFVWPSYKYFINHQLVAILGKTLQTNINCIPGNKCVVRCSTVDSLRAFIHLKLSTEFLIYRPISFDASYVVVANSNKTENESNSLFFDSPPNTVRFSNEILDTKAGRRSVENDTPINHAIFNLFYFGICVYFCGMNTEL